MHGRENESAICAGSLEGIDENETQSKVFFMICFRATALGVVLAPVQQIRKPSKGKTCGGRRAGVAI